MTGASDIPGDENAGEKRFETSLPGALEFGEERQRLDSEQGQIAQELNGLAARQTAADEKLKRDLGQVEAFHQMELEDLEDERNPLVKRRGQLEEDRKSLQGKVSHWMGRLRTLASDPNAKRGDQLMYAAFATSGDTSQEGLSRMGELDELVKENGGEIVVTVQGANVAFGVLREHNNGLIIDPQKERSTSPDHMERVRLPMRGYDLGGGETSPAYVYVSGSFDEAKLEYSWDSVLNRSKDEESTTDLGSFCGFNIEDAHLHLPEPTNLAVTREFDGEVDSEKILSNQDEDRILVGEAALNFLHAFIDGRLEQLGVYDKDMAIKESGGLTVMAAQLGISIDLTRLQRFNPRLIR